MYVSMAVLRETMAASLSGAAYPKYSKPAMLAAKFPKLRPAMMG